MISNIEVVTINVLNQVDYRERFPNAFSGEFGDKFVARLSDLPNSVTNLMMNLLNYQIDWFGEESSEKHSESRSDVIKWI